MKNYLKNWNIMRLVRLAIGIAIAVQGWLNNEWIFVILGTLFSLMPLFDLGCQSGSCSTSISKRKSKNVNVKYDEIK